ncbi:hypothetical protein KUTeg_005185 [Tegillarca granosa]|uniref:Uncharacterized protein n=1 Tax=Tegillarca granosa TaxID=220873 RepID=A0ABQ9FKS6_TEGGR|nr:hypothetical protein KUTeg_005185 [Tegillarca granosa]
MTASSGEQNTKRPNGFSIDSIIGKQSEKSDNVKNSCTNNNRKDPEIFVSSQSSPERHEGFRTTSSTKDKKELSYGIHHHNNSVSSNSRETSNISPLSPTSRTRDDFTSAIHPSARDSLKDLHEVLAQTAGATGTYMSPRLCRHPLSALNLHSIYPSHLQQASPIHPLVLNSTRDIRHLHPWLSERYPSHYYYPRYPVIK